MTCSYQADTKTLYCSGGGTLSNQYNEKYQEAKNLIIDDIEMISSSCFQYYSYIDKVNLGNKLKVIGDDPFPEAKIKELVIPKSVTSISKWNPFDSMPFLENITVEKGNKNYLSEDSILYTIDKKTLVCIPNKKVISKFIIPQTVKEVQRYSMSSQSFIRDLIIHDRISNIELFPPNLESVIVVHYCIKKELKFNLPTNKVTEHVTIKCNMLTCRPKSNYKRFDNSIFCMILISHC